MAQIVIPESELPVLKIISELDNAVFTSLAKALKAATPRLIREEFAEQISKNLKNFTPEQTSDLLGTLYPLYLLMDRNSVSTNEMADEIQAALIEDKASGFDSAKAKILHKRLKVLLNCWNTLGVTAKALSVVRQAPHVYCSARIMSDIRMVFADGPSKASAGVIIHNLQVGFHDTSDERKEFYVTLDDSDLQQLKETIVRAEEKSEALKKLMAQSKILHLEV